MAAETETQFVRRTKTSDPDMAEFEAVADAIREDWDHAEQHHRGAMRYAFRCGGRFASVQAKLKPRGKWTDWLDQHYFNRKTAYNYLAVYLFYGTEDRAASGTIADAVHAERLKKKRAASRKAEHDVRGKGKGRTPEGSKGSPSPEDGHQGEGAAWHLDRVLDSLRALSLARDGIDWRSLAKQWREVGDLFRDLDEHLAVSVHSFYSTPPEAVAFLLDREDFGKDEEVIDPCCGDGAITGYLTERGHTRVRGSDKRFDVSGVGGVDAMSILTATNIMTNPPFDGCVQLAKHMVSIATGKVALLMPGRRDAQLLRAGVREWDRRYVLTDRPRFLAGGIEEVSLYDDVTWFLWENSK